MFYIKMSPLLKNRVTPNEVKVEVTNPPVSLCDKLASYIFINSYSQFKLRNGGS